MLVSNYQYVDNVALKKIQEVMTELFTKNSNPEEFLDKIKETLPVHQTDELTWKKRLEGFYEVSERLFKRISDKMNEIKSEKWDREKIIRESNIKSIYYYQNYSRKDELDSSQSQLSKFFASPLQALIKLEDDIISLVKLYHMVDKEIKEQQSQNEIPGDQVI